MDGARLHRLIQRGHAKAARHIGLPYKVYRPFRRLEPIDLLGARPDVLATFSPKSDFEFKSPAAVKDTVFSVVTDGELDHGDYLIGESGTFFVSDTGHLTAPVCVRCSTGLKLLRQKKPEGFGPLGYRTEVSNEERVIATLPGSLTRTSQGGRFESGLPGNSSAPEALVQWPDLSRLGVDPGFDEKKNQVDHSWKPDEFVIRTSDVLEDDLRRRWNIVAAELTVFGWRLWCRLLASG